MARTDPDHDPRVPDPPAGGADALLAGALGLTRTPRPTRSRLLIAAASVLLLTLLLLWLLPRALDLDLPRIGTTLASVPGTVLLLAVALGALSVLLEGAAARAVLPGAPVAPTLRAQAAAGATALVIPGGSLLGIAIVATTLRRRRVPTRTVASGIAAFSLTDVLFSGVAIPLLALLAYGLLGRDHDLPGSVGAVVLGLLGVLATLAAGVLVLHRPSAVRVLDALGPTITSVLEMTGRGGGSAAGGSADGGAPATAALEVRDRVAGLLARRWAGVLIPLLLGRAAQFAVLVITLRSLGADVGLLPLLGVFLVGRAVSLVPVTPGGGGLTETALALLLVSLGTAPATAAAASLVLGASALVVPVVLGAALGLRELATRRR
ncbi:hypothetical protein DEO23_03640 [Brachybacterium endophyticum]|uniref:Uncharacterized protein n=1 Tax=Brachybacterium endophyticum TaxID=2182385 RepID=A0A2U2RPF8_9MICO|nr:lysylphosphatidylglycerol synthase domain-containing protein [Brachybacterium endophyticum]PWH07721.1 hypothetical protein DEO23_03640 [Brachybacterium endophyticum]